MGEGIRRGEMVFGLLPNVVRGAMERRKTPFVHHLGKIKKGKTTATTKENGLVQKGQQ